MKVWVVTEHFAYESGRFDSAWSEEKMARERAACIEKIPPIPDWTEVIEADVDRVDAGGSREAAPRQASSCKKEMNLSLATACPRSAAPD